MQQSRLLVHGFLAALSAGELPDSMLTEDMTAWITTQGRMSRQEYQSLIKILKHISAQPLAFTVDSITAEDDRIVAEVHGEAVLINGKPYTNTYVFVFRVRDGQIASIAEHFNALIVEEELVPLVRGIRQEERQQVIERDCID